MYVVVYMYMKSDLVTTFDATIYSCLSMLFLAFWLSWIYVFWLCVGILCNAHFELKTRRETVGSQLTLKAFY